MIRSMTGFGRASFRVESSSFDVEVRSVNHRYLDVRVRLPRSMVAFEADVREAVRAHFSRGKIDITVAIPGSGSSPTTLEVDVDIARQYLKAARELSERDQLAGSLDVSSVLALPGVTRFVEVELSEEALRTALVTACTTALEAVDEMRKTEGAALERDLSERLNRVGELCDEIQDRAGEVQISVRERLKKRAKQLAQETGLHDDARLHQEIVIAADRLDITEETVRLASHRAQFREIMALPPGEAVGRKLDFLLQEFGREANTIGSKGSDAPIAHRVVELKAELERLREQVQNVE